MPKTFKQIDNMSSDSEWERGGGENNDVSDDDVDMIKRLNQIPNIWVKHFLI